MIVISGVEYETRGADRALILSASWIDGLRFRYIISRRGIKVEGLEGKRPRRSALMIHSFSIAVHDDVWSLFLVQRFEPLLKTIHGIRHFLFHTDTPPLQREDIGTSFGVGNAAEVADTLRSMGYRVNELRWVDMLRTTARALQPAE
jgi:hypothetical protein